MKKRNILIGMAVTYVAIFLIFYPSFNTFYDESQYIHATWLLKEGKSIRVENALDSLVFTRHGKDFVSQYPVGVPMILVPFALFSWKTLFLSGMILHLIGFFIFKKILRKLGFDEIFAALYLFFPGFVFFSRTVMSEIPSIVVILAAFYFYLGERKRDNIATGLFFGIACLFRYTNLFVFVAFAAIIFIKAIKQKRDKEKLVLMFLGFLPATILILWSNMVIYGGIFETAITSPRPEVWQTITILWKCIAVMTVAYPLMIAAPFAYKGKARWEIMLSTCIFIIMFSYAGVDTFHYDFAKNMVIGARYLFPIVPLILIAYVPFFMHLCAYFRLRYKAVLYLAIIVLVAGAIVISYKQHQFTDASKQISDTIYRNTEKGSLIFGNGYTLSFINNFRGERKAASITTHRSPEDPDKEYTDESRGFNYIYDNYKNYTTYIVFLDQQFVQDFRYENEAELMEEGKIELLGRFNSTLVYSQESPSPLSIYRIT